MSEKSQQYIDSAKTIRREAQRLKGMDFAADVLEQLGSIEQTTEQANAARATAERERDAAKVQLVEARVNLEAAAAQATKTLAMAKDSAANIAIDAHARAMEIQEKARKTAQEKAMVELEEADKRLTAINTNVAQASGRLDALNAKARDAKESADVMNEAAAVAEKRLATAQEQIRKTLEVSKV